MNREDIIGQLTAELQDLKIRVAQLEAAAVPSEGNESSASVPTILVLPLCSCFRRGDRVKSTTSYTTQRRGPTTSSGTKNTLKQLLSHNYKGQLHFVTDNGIKTWQATNNLTRIG